MTNRKRTILVGTGVFVLGLAVGFAGGDFASHRSFQNFLDVLARTSTQATAKRAQTELLQLQLLRSGEVEEVVDQLELFVDSRSATMRYFDQTLAPSPEGAFNRRILGEIDAYREEYPTGSD